MSMSPGVMPFSPRPPAAAIGVVRVPVGVQVERHLDLRPAARCRGDAYIREAAEDTRRKSGDHTQILCRLLGEGFCVARVVFIERYSPLSSNFPERQNKQTVTRSATCK